MLKMLKILQNILPTFRIKYKLLNTLKTLGHDTQNRHKETLKGRKTRRRTGQRL